MLTKELTDPASRLFISLGNSFAELLWSRGTQHQFHRWLLARESLEGGLRRVLQNPDLAALQANEQSPLPIYLYSQQAERSLKGRPPTKMALLVTQGFEDWLHLREPVHPSDFALNLRPSRFLLSKEYIFGLNERGSPSGEILLEPKTEDIEFFVEKLRLLEITHVAVNFLHAHRCPQNEKKLGEQLREAGFTVFLSSEVDGEAEEGRRWRGNTIRTWMSCHEQEETLELEETFAKLGNLSLHPCPARGLHFPLVCLGRKLLNENEDRAVLHLGLEGFFLVWPGEAVTERVSPWGLVPSSGSRIEKLPFQPTCLLGLDEWSEVAYEREVGYEPGPMSLGRGVRPTLFDVWACQGRLSCPDLDPLIKAEIFPRFRESFAALARHSISFSELSQDVSLELFEAQIRQEVLSILAGHNIKNLLLTGPLAASLGPAWLQNSSVQWQVHHQANELVARALDEEISS